MAITRLPVHCRRAFVLSAALTLAACSSSSTNNDGAQGGSGGAASAKSGGSTAGVDAAVARTGGFAASTGGSTVSSGGTTSLGGSTAGVDAAVTSTGGVAASSGTVAIRVPGLGAAGFNYTQGSYLTGFVFRANIAIGITQFGYYDSNLTGGVETFQPHAVGVYDLSTHTLLGSATVQPSDPVTGLFHYVSLTNPIALNTTDTYAIVGVTGTNNYTVGITASEAPVNAALTYVSGAGYGPSNNNATMTSTLVEPNAFDAGNIFGQPTPAGTLCDFGPNFMFVASSGGSDAGADAPVTSPGDAAAGSDGSTTKPDGATGSGGVTGSDGSTSLGGATSAGGATGSGGRDAGTAGASGPTCTPGQAPTNFGNVATSDSNPNYTSGVGLLTATEFLTFNGYAGPDSADGGTAAVNRIDVQHFDPITGKSKGSATPLFTAAGDGSGLYLNAAAVAPTGEIAIIYSAATGTSYGVYLAFLDKDLALSRTTQFVAFGSDDYQDQSHVQWLNGNFVASAKIYTAGYRTIKLGKFGADGSNAGGTSAIPTDDPSGHVDINDVGQGEVAFSGGQFAVSYLSTSQFPYLTILDTLGTEIGVPLPLPSAVSGGFVSVAGTSQGFVAVYNGTSPATKAGSLLATFVSNSGSGDSGVSGSGDAGMAPIGATYAFTGGYAFQGYWSAGGSSDGTGAGFAVLYPDGSVSFLYFSGDGSTHLSPQAVLTQANGATNGDEARITNFAGNFAVSLYSSAEHLTRMVASICK